ncbi:putative motility protein [Chitinivibrio alkaliphilus]|nr:putative motility protein [Chitinivibrio alkaliphilus]
MSDVSVGGVNQARLAVEINSRLQKTAIDSAETTAANLLRAMPQSANMPNQGTQIDLQG